MDERQKIIDQLVIAAGAIGHALRCAEELRDEVPPLHPTASDAAELVKQLRQATDAARRLRVRLCQPGQPGLPGR